MVHLKEHKHEKWLLKHNRQAGDILVMTTLVKQIRETFGDELMIKCDTPVCQEIWFNNPHVTDFPTQETDRFLMVDYKCVLDNPQWQLHHSYGFKIDFERQTGIQLPNWDCRPVIQLSDYELELAKQYKDCYGDNYWVIALGTKPSCTVKAWPIPNWKEVISSLRDLNFVQIGEKKEDKFNLGEHDNLVDLSGETGVRDLFSIVYASNGVISYNSFCMHIAAAFNKKAIIIAGGREPIWYQQYPNQIVLNHSSSIKCGDNGVGCFKNNIKDCTNGDTSDGEILYPYCTLLINPGDVIYLIDILRKGVNV